ncbi:MULTISPECIES: hypothetical protein [Pseudomonas]|jgi:hypothetical protein|uniref:hypothetical protein n=1 Tax=Pseudomonas TaxID=286 RepID=UPI00054B137C|nr:MULTISPECIES: hypothetical protein [Pseudomonas]KII34006.1 hypothetical protein RY26_16665 [Pseudomonas fluorescens]
MSDSAYTSTGEFSAETEGGERLLFYTTLVDLAISSRPVPVPYWQAIGDQEFSGPLPRRHAYLSVYFPVGATTGTYQLTKDGDYRGSYAVGTLGDPVSYFSKSGEITLTIVPSSEGEQVEGTVFFTALNEKNGQEVSIKNGKFKMKNQTFTSAATKRRGKH